MPLITTAALVGPERRKTSGLESLREETDGTSRARGYSHLHADLSYGDCVDVVYPAPLLEG